MEKRDESDRKIRELFSTARRVDRMSAPNFVSMKTAVREQGRRSTAARAFGFALMSGSATVMIAAVVMWIAVKSPTAVVPEAPAPPARWDTAVAPVAPDEPVPVPVPAQQDPPKAPPPSPAQAALRSGASQPVVLSGGLLGSVHDSDGMPLPGATVTISNEQGFVQTTARLTNRNGRFEFPILRPGAGYALHVSFPGFASARQNEITVNMGQEVELSVQLTSEIVERVRVTAARSVVDLESTATTTRFTEEYISDLPVPGRFYQNVITMAPGANDRDGDGNANVHGARDRDFAAMVSGVKNIDPLTGQFMSQVNPNSIEDREVITAVGGVEFGRAQGGFARIVQRQGATKRPRGFNTESYSPIVENEFRHVADHPLSTFSVDVDTASYANMRRFLKRGQLPPHDAVRIEELINYFNYDYPSPEGGDPFSVNVEIADCPWAPDHRLARIGLKGRTVDRGEFVGSNLVFLIDVSGSMQPRKKLPLLKSALSMLVDQLDDRDQVAIVVYAGAAGLVLPSTSGRNIGEIRNALDRLEAGGSTNGGEGILLAYRIARENFISGGVNRVILATDGDFNVGVTDNGSLLRMIEKDARAGIFLTTLGFGRRNYKDDMLERLADKGNGNYAYIDSLREARKVLVEQVAGTLVTIAKDVKIQVEFNPRQTAGYRLIGYENRMLHKEDFNDDRKDAGEIGAGHTVTALYEIVPASDALPATGVDPLKYQTTGAFTDAALSGELFTLKLRYKEPESSTSELLTYPIVDEGYALESASADFKFASAVACFGMLLRQSRFAGVELLDEVRGLAREGVGVDRSGYRTEFQHLVEIAAPLLQQREVD